MNDLDTIQQALEEERIDFGNPLNLYDALHGMWTWDTVTAPEMAELIKEAVRAEEADYYGHPGFRVHGEVDDEPCSLHLTLEGDRWRVLAVFYP